jgi:SAM-dependent methyltransferase
MNHKNVVRRHDELYLNENRYEKAKQLHLDIIDLIKGRLAFKNMLQSSDVCISDFGCAAGEFEYSLKLSFPTCNIEGYELLPNLVEKAKSRVPNVKFQQGSVTDRFTCPPAHSDFTLLVGVLSIFDAFEPVLDNLIYWTKAGGDIYIHSLFNDFDLDVNIKYNHSEEYSNNVLESGWNIFSKKTISNWLDAHSDVSAFEFHDFKINIELAKQEDSIRSWTFEDSAGRKLITNGLCILQPHSILHIVKK